MPVITNIDDLKRIYRRRVPKMFYDYAESGSWTEQTFRDNTTDFDRIYLKQRVAIDMTGRNLATQMIGQDVAMPVGLAPVGLTGMQHADGEIKAARAAEKFGVPFTLSTMSICSIEDVAENTEKPFWFQVYTLKDDDFMQRLFDRARDANCSAAMITVDLQMLGQRHKDLKNGLSAPPKLTPASVANLSTCANMEDYNSFGPRSAAKAARGVQLARSVIATELLCAAEGVEAHRPHRSGQPVEDAIEIIRQVVPPLTEDRTPSPDIAAINSLIEKDAFGPLLG